MQAYFQTEAEATACAAEQSNGDGVPRYVIEAPSQPAERRFRCDTSSAVTGDEKLVRVHKSDKNPDVEYFDKENEAGAAAIKKSASDDRTYYVIEAQTFEPPAKAFRIDPSNALAEGEREVHEYLGATSESKNPYRTATSAHRKPALTPSEIEERKRRGLAPLTPAQIEAQRRGKPDPRALTPAEIEQKRKLESTHPQTAQRTLTPEQARDEQQHPVLTPDQIEQKRQQEAQRQQGQRQ